MSALFDFSVPQKHSWRQVVASSSDPLFRLSHGTKTGMMTEKEEIMFFLEYITEKETLDMQMVLARLTHPSTATATINYGWGQENFPFLTAVFECAADRMGRGDPVLFERMLTDGMVNIWTEVHFEHGLGLLSQTVSENMRPAIIERMLADIAPDDLNAIKFNNLPPLGLAVTNGDFDLALALIERGACVSWSWSNNDIFEEEAWLRYAWETMSEHQAAALESAFKNRG